MTVVVRIIISVIIEFVVVRYNIAPARGCRAMVHDMFILISNPLVTSTSARGSQVLLVEFSSEFLSGCLPSEFLIQSLAIQIDKQIDPGVREIFIP